MKNKILIILGFFLGLISAYPPLGWIYIFYSNAEATHLEKQSIFYRRALLGLNPEYFSLIHLTVILCGVLSVFVFAFLLNKLSKRMISQKFKNRVNVVYISILTILTLITLLNLWFIL